MTSFRSCHRSSSSFRSTSISISVNFNGPRSFLCPFSIHSSLNRLLFSFFFFFVLFIDVFLQSRYFTVTSDHSFFYSFCIINNLKEWIKACWFFCNLFLFFSGSLNNFAFNGSVLNLNLIFKIGSSIVFFLFRTFIFGVLLPFIF